MKSTVEKVKENIEGLFNWIEIFKQNQEQIDYSDKETVDLLHEIEINPNPKQKFFTDLKKTREKRRKYKDENDLIVGLVNYLENNIKLKNDLTMILNAVKKKDTNQKGRKYKPLVRKDLTIPTYKENKEYEVEKEVIDNE